MPRADRIERKFKVFEGTIHSLYEDGLSQRILERSGGKAHIRRASHVEASQSAGIQFEVDLSPMGGPKLTGFPTRKEAITAEIQWLNKNIFTTSNTTNHTPMP
jgi:hypothetical protein